MVTLVTLALAIALSHVPPDLGARVEAALETSRVLRCIRWHEATGDYRAVDPTGTYFGAYQSDLSTWRVHAPAAWRDVRPDRASRNAQDQFASRLREDRGLQPWSDEVRRECA